MIAAEARRAAKPTPADGRTGSRPPMPRSRRGSSRRPPTSRRLREPADAEPAASRTQRQPAVRRSVAEPDAANRTESRTRRRRKAWIDAREDLLDSLGTQDDSAVGREQDDTRMQPDRPVTVCCLPGGVIGPFYLGGGYEDWRDRLGLAVGLVFFCAAWRRRSCAAASFLARRTVRVPEIPAARGLSNCGLPSAWSPCRYGWRFLRMADARLRAGSASSSSLFGGLVITVLGWPPKLGIDLSGGVILVYEIEEDRRRGRGEAQEAERRTRQTEPAPSGPRSTWTS